MLGVERISRGVKGDMSVGENVELQLLIYRSGPLDRALEKNASVNNEKSFLVSWLSNEFVVSSSAVCSTYLHGWFFSHTFEKEHADILSCLLVDAMWGLKWIKYF